MKSGSDYYYMIFSDRPTQKKVFIRQLELVEVDLPIIVHMTASHGDIMDILATKARTIRLATLRSWDTKRLINWDSISYSPVFPKSTKQRVAKQVLLDRISLKRIHHLTPPNRGRRNDLSNTIVA